MASHRVFRAPLILNRHAERRKLCRRSGATSSTPEFVEPELVSHRLCSRPDAALLFAASRREIVMHRHRLQIGLAGAAALALTNIAVGPVSLRADSSPVFSGQATVVRATLTTPLGPQTVVVSDTGPLPQSGGALENSILDAGVPGLLAAEVGHASTIGQGDRSRSEASVASLTLSAGGNTISSDFLMANAMAVCASGAAAVSGSSDIATLTINGQTIVVSGTPNQTIGLPLGGAVIINQQTSNGPGDITVSALHITVPGLVDVVIASAHADISCPTPPSQPLCRGSDFVTGGGWIDSPSGGRANFAVAGGIKNGAFWGHLQYVDHGPGGPRVSGTGVTDYEITNPTTRHIEGHAAINDGSGSYKVDVSDQGEPGTNDTFSLQLSPTGYWAGGNLRGGNIQLHRPCQ
jgi:hypothetical protein